MTVTDASGCQRFLEETRDASPANFLIKYESFSLICEYGIDKYESRVFEAGGYKWKMIIYPEGYKSDNDGCYYVSVYFAIAESLKLILFPWGGRLMLSSPSSSTIITIPIISAIEMLHCSETTRRLNALVPKRGSPKMISYKTLVDPSKGYLVDDTCVFGAEIFVINSKPINECLNLVKDIAPYKRGWKISGFSELEYVWTSQQFKVGDHKWRVVVYPKGETDPEEEDGYVSVFLKCVDIEGSAPHRKVNAETILRIKSHDLSDTHHPSSIISNTWFTPSSPSWGYAEFIAVADMSSRGFLVDDCCFLEVEISVQASVLDSPQV